MTTTPLEMRPLGSTGLEVSAVTLGGGPLGSMPHLFGREVAERDGIAVVHAALDAGIRTIDTSNGYSDGESERRIGKAIAEYGGLPDGTIVVTKVDPDGADYSGDRVRRSLEESAERLGFAPFPLVHLHDPEFHDFDMMTAPGGAVDALVEAREQRTAGHIGLAGGDVRVMSRYLELGVFDVLLVHNRWTLVDRSAGAILDRAEADGMGLINAAVLGGGILGDPTGTVTNYAYRPASPATLAAVAAIRDACARWGTDIATAAIAFSTRNRRFATTVVGISRADKVAPTIASATAELPDGFWAEIEELLPAPSNWVDAD